MTDTPDLDALLGLARKRRNDPPGLTADIAAARKAEKQKRTNTATGLAITALRRLHADDFQALTRQAQAKVDAECGPLPGDEAA